MKRKLFLDRRTIPIRNKRIDIIKGVGIIMVVWQHCKLFGSEWVSLFHMAIFIMASGYCYKGAPKERDDYVNAILRKVRSLYIPYVLINVSMTFLYSALYDRIPNLAESIGYDRGVPSASFLLKRVLLQILFVKVGPWEVQAWFLRNLFFVTMLFLSIDYIISNTKWNKARLQIHLGLGGMLLIVGYVLMRLIEQNAFAYNIERLLYSYIIYTLGLLINLFESTYNQKQDNRYYLLWVICAIALWLMTKFGKVSYMMAQIVNPLFFLIVSVLGWVMLSSFSYLVENNFKVLKNLFVLFGQRSMWIFSLHMLVIWVARMIFVNFGVASCSFALFILGIIVPIIISFIVNQAVKRLNECVYYFEN